jgi:hypothetical protein
MCSVLVSCLWEEKSSPLPKSWRNGMLRQFRDWLNVTSNKPEHLDHTYLFFRRGLAVVGFGFPIILIIGRWVLESHGILDSISAYYYSVMKNFFVGILCAIGTFLICYRYERKDDILGDVAGFFAIGVGLFPPAPDNGASGPQMVIGVFHYIFAVGFFITSAVFALCLFRKTDQENPKRRKRQRNMVYLFCGIAIVVCLALIGLHRILPDYSWLKPLHPDFWLEFIALLAFGLAWLVKADWIILKDGKGGWLNDKEQKS